MRLIDVLTSPWAIVPDKLSEIISIYDTHLRGEKIDIDQIEARTGEPLKRKEKEAYIVQDGVALISIDGVIAKKMNLFTRISGGASTQMLVSSIDKARNDPNVKSALLIIDSPGGTVDGTSDAADAVRRFRDDKPIVALADGLMASAAYWIGSAATAVYASNATTAIGSIGVVASHVDMSEYEKKIGVKTTEIYAGKYKRIASDRAPLSDEGRATIQDHVDYLYSIFVEAVAQNRGVSVDAVLESMADGRIFVGQRAVDAGLVDGVSTQSALMAQLIAGHFGKKTGAGVAQSKQVKEYSMTTKEIVAQEHPEIAEAFRAEGMVIGIEKGAQQERERIQAVEEQALLGHDALIAKLKFDGKTTGPEAAVQVLAAERSKNANRLDTLRQSVAAPVQPSMATEPIARQDDSGKTPEEIAEGRWSRDAALREEFMNNKAAYLSFAKADHEGKVRILGRR